MVWRDDGHGSWRRKGWSVADKLLLSVVDERRFTNAAEYLALIPDDLAVPFTNQSLAKSLGARRSVAGKMTYCLRRMGLLHKVGKEGRFDLYGIGDR